MFKMFGFLPVHKHVLIFDACTSHGSITTHFRHGVIF